MFSLPFSVTRDISINKPISEVIEFIADFENWVQWSPWLYQDPDCQYEITGDSGKVGHQQQWTSSLIGCGTMRLEERATADILEYDLEFLKPWKSRSKVKFLFKAKGDQTAVTWTMQGSVPIFLFFMRKMMAAFVGADYDRGLAMLKEVLEKGEPTFTSKYCGRELLDGFYYLGIARRCSLDDISKSMTDDFSVLDSMLRAGDLPQPDQFISLYPEYDVTARSCQYICGFSYHKRPQNLKGHNLAEGSVDSHHAILVEQSGPYQFVGNAWSLAFTHQRAAKSALNKGIHMYEVYMNDPKKVQPNEIKTKIFLPVK